MNYKIKYQPVEMLLVINDQWYLTDELTHNAFATLKIILFLT